MPQRHVHSHREPLHCVRVELRDDKEFYGYTVEVRDPQGNVTRTDRVPIPELQFMSAKEKAKFIKGFFAVVEQVKARYAAERN